MYLVTPSEPSVVPAAGRQNCSCRSAPAVPSLLPQQLEGHNGVLKLSPVHMQLTTVISGRLPAGNVLIFLQTVLGVGYRKVRVM